MPLDVPTGMALDVPAGWEAVWVGAELAAEVVVWPLLGAWLDVHPATPAVASKARVSSIPRLIMIVRIPGAY
jgi:hypothetical protein